MPQDVRRAVARRAQIAVPALLVIIAARAWLTFGPAPVPAPIPPCPAAACVID